MPEIHGDRCWTKHWNNACYYWPFLLGVLVVLIGLLGIAVKQWNRAEVELMKDRKARYNESQQISVAVAALAVAEKARIDAEAAQKRSEAMEREARDFARTLENKANDLIKKIAYLENKAAKCASGMVTVSNSTLAKEIKEDADKLQKAALSFPTDGPSLDAVACLLPGRLHVHYLRFELFGAARAVDQGGLFGNPLRARRGEIVKQDGVGAVCGAFTVVGYHFAVNDTPGTGGGAAQGSVRQFDEPYPAAHDCGRRQVGFGQRFLQPQPKTSKSLGRIRIADHGPAVSGFETGIENLVSSHAAPGVRSCRRNRVRPATTFDGGGCHLGRNIPDDLR